MQYNNAPDWLRSANNHGVASDGTTIFEDIGMGIRNAPSFLAVSIASGLNSFYNTGISVGNIFRSEDNKYEMRDTGEWISSYDEDLGAYYRDNKAGADLVGFIAGSLVPGLGAIKGLNAAQSAMRVAQAGQVGRSTSWATKLLAPSMETYVKREAATLAAQNSTFRFLHTNSLKALGSGAHQSLLESVAFEVAVAATMYKSPILEDMDGGDILKNGLIGAAFGTVLGTGFAAAKTYFDVGKLVKGADARQRMFSRITPVQESSEHLPTDRLMSLTFDREYLLKNVPTEDWVRQAKIAAGETGESLAPEAVKAEFQRLLQVRDTTLNTIQNEIRTGIRALAKEDGVGNFATDVLEGLDDTGIRNLLFNAKEFTRAGRGTEFEATLKAMVKEGRFKNLNEAKKYFSDEAVQETIRLHSGAIGERVAGSGGVMRIADRFSPEKAAKMFENAKLKFNDKLDFRKIMDPEQVELRWYAARNAPEILRLGETQTIGAFDLPALWLAKDRGWTSIKLDNGQVLEGASSIRQYYHEAQVAVLEAQKQNGRHTGTIELLTDIRKDAIEGTAKKGITDDMFMSAQESYAAELSEFLSAKSAQPIQLTAKELHTRPSLMKVVYDTRSITDDTGMELKAQVLLEHRAALAKEASDRYFASYAGDLAEAFPDSGMEQVATLWRGEHGAGKFSNAGGAYGSFSSWASMVGDLVAELKKTKIKALTEEMTPVIQALRKSPDDAIRFSSISATISNTPEKYVLSQAGDELIPYKLKRYFDDVAAGKDVEPPVLAQGTPESIPLETDTIRDAVAAHIAITDRQLLDRAGTHALQGNLDEKIAGVFRPVRPDPRDYKHVAFVKDNSIVGVGHTKMIFAQSGEELQEMIKKVHEIGPYYQVVERPANVKTYTLGQNDDWFKALGEWQYSRTLHEDYINPDFHSRGIMSTVFPKTDPDRIVEEWYQNAVRQENSLVTEAVNMKYAREFEQIDRLANEFEMYQRSIKGAKTIHSGGVFSQTNPYAGAKKSMLNLTKLEEMPLMTNMQASLDNLVSTAWNKAQEVFTTTRKFDDAAINRINEIFEEIGFKSAYADTATAIMANSPIPRGVLTSFVRTANAFLTTTILRLDAFNAINNTVGTAVLYSSELTNVLDGIRKGNAEVVGDLARLSQVAVPGAEGASMLSPFKLFSESIRRLHDPELGPALRAEYAKRGLVPDMADQYFKSLDPLTLTGKESVRDVTTKIGKIKETAERWAKNGEKWTGNRWAEQFSRLIAADTMKQITELAVKAGTMTDDVAWSYVNTFTKRINSVIRAAERPLMFQGPVGQAIGLFQSYQLNLLQNIFRNAGEGRGKALAMMAGMQSTVYGASSLPGFNLINHHLIGTAAGNEEHSDLYSAAYNIFGQNGAEWLMYGAPSNILNASLYTRGDTNPRYWHVVPNPTRPQDIPFINAFSKAIGAVVGSAKQIGNDVPVAEALIGGLEHSGLSRPLAGIMAVGRSMTRDDGLVVSTQRNGGLAGSNDLVSWASLVRVLGAKPIDEAIVTNAYFRVGAYAEYDRRRRESLGTELKRTIQAGQPLDYQTVGRFAEEYVSRGGSQTGFNQWWMNQYKNATRSQALQMADALDSPYARHMQRILGGRESMFDVDSY